MRRIRLIFDMSEFCCFRPSILKQPKGQKYFMAIFVVLQSYLLTTKLSCLQKNNFGHTKPAVHRTQPENRCHVDVLSLVELSIPLFFSSKEICQIRYLVVYCIESLVRFVSAIIMLKNGLNQERNHYFKEKLLVHSNFSLQKSHCGISTSLHDKK